MLDEQRDGEGGRRGRIALLAVSFVAVAVLGALAGIGVYELLADDADEAAPAPAAASTTPAPAPASPSWIADLYEQVAPGVVEITAAGVSGSDPFGPFGPPGGGAAQGSGFVIDEEGTILTNQHVVDGASTLEVMFADGATVEAELVGVDASTDIAVLDVDVPADELTPLPLGGSASVRPGEAVVAIGSPFGLEGSITAGIVSAVGRTMRAPNGYSIAGSIQTDAPINTGNSGGPLIDAAGSVIGVNAQIESSSGGNEGVGFAIPIDAARRVAEALLAGESVAYPYLGAQLTDAPSAGGAEIAAVQSGSPAEEAGLREGDVVVAVDGRRVRSSGELVAAVGARDPGDAVTLTVTRDGEDRDVEVTLGTRPS